MLDTSPLARITSLAAAFLFAGVLAGCEEPADCPAPTAEAPVADAKVAPAAATGSAASAPPPAAALAGTVATHRAAPPALATTSPKKPRVVEAAGDCADDGSCAADLYVKRLVLARGVKDREPTEPTTSFAKGERQRVYAFVEVGNRDETASLVYVAFQPKGGKERGRVRLAVGASPRWRTWAYTELATEVGEWEAIVYDARGDVLGRQAFTVTDGSTAADPYEAVDRERATSKP